MRASEFLFDGGRRALHDEVAAQVQHVQRRLVGWVGDDRRLDRCALRGPHAILESDSDVLAMARLAAPPVVLPKSNIGHSDYTTSSLCTR